MSSFTDERDDDVRLPTRGSERRTITQHEARESNERDREFTLSTGTVLGIFFALALICAVFFGFGYTMGRKSGQTTAEASAPASTPTGDVAVNKPSPGAPVIQAIPGYLSQSEAETANRNSATQTYKAPVASGASTTVVIPTTSSVVAPAKPARIVAATPNETAASSPEPRPVPALEKRPIGGNAITPVPPPSPAGGAASYVQIAAVSHQEDADVLLSALKRRGYAVFTRPSESDRLIHVQVGPFASKKDAETMRQKLLGDGYNAIVK